VDEMLKQGVTCFIPTIITATEDRICHALNVIQRARESDVKTFAAIPFVHMEGPYISPFDGFRGAHPKDAVRTPSIAEFDRWQSAAGGCVGMVTLSPHFENAELYIRALVKRGVPVAIGHTHASQKQIRGAVMAGARLSTHLGNGIAQQIPRHLNPIWPQLAEDNLTATVIADGHHLPVDMLQVMLRVKGDDRIILISDQVALAGMAPGVYTTAVGGRVELHADGRLCVFGSELLAGTTASLPQCVSYLVREVGIPLYRALAMATANPGNFVQARGTLAPGRRADVIAFRWRHGIVIEDVWFGGEHIYSRTDAGSKQAGDA
jgi:N-acetylglucosamine-6-phosphate deacetylase